MFTSDEILKSKSAGLHKICINIPSSMNSQDIFELPLLDQVSSLLLDKTSIPGDRFQLESFAPIPVMAARAAILSKQNYLELISSIDRIGARSVCAVGEMERKMIGRSGLMVDAVWLGPPLNDAVVGSVILPRSSHWVDEYIAVIMGLGTKNAMKAGGRKFVPIPIVPKTTST